MDDKEFADLDDKMRSEVEENTEITPDLEKDFERWDKEVRRRGQEAYDRLHKNG